ncbi:hypothetical protein SDC9_188275 [bioreactor metagenome]|uniref:Permease n=1 Tax=bioreactor metagenome TaxID=1076179 RepID=A0A645HQA8_9ZZZZ
MKTYLALIFSIIFVLMFLPNAAWRILIFSFESLKTFLIAIFPVFLCTGLMDVWLEKKTMIKIMGKDSGVKGIIISLIMGMLTALPLYAVLPVASMLLKKGSKLSNVLVFIGASSNLRIPLLIFETLFIGLKFTSANIVSGIVSVLIVSFITNLILSPKDKQTLYSNSENFF